MKNRTKKPRLVTLKTTWLAYLKDLYRSYAEVGWETQAHEIALEIEYTLSASR